MLEKPMFMYKGYCNVDPEIPINFIYLAKVRECRGFCVSYCVLLTRKKVLLFPTGPFLKLQRVTLTLLFSYIIPEKDRCVYNKKSQCNYSDIVFKNKKVGFKIRN
ncbi:TPA: hypothetical protein ROY24_001527 [Bacillus cereus]|nr:hypothetical protein KQ1_02219 [Bacillus cereus BAG3O-1]PFF83411.1 hypothetical protein CN338_27500 [Bacillus cereus]HDX9668527.1 hypothetical protein [Bacillus cereus]